MDNFNKIIKEKVEQFDVPFNDAHWAEMEGKLNTIKTAKIKATILGSAAVIALIAISGYFLYENNAPTSETNTNVIAQELTNITTEKLLFETEYPIKDKPTATNEIINIRNKNAISIKKENILENEFITEESSKENLENDFESNTEYPQKNNSLQTVNAEFIVFNNNVCLGEKVSFEAIENNNQVTYVWNFGDGTSSYEKNPSHIYTKSDNYSVSLTLINRQSGKKETTTQKNIVTILQTPKISFNYSETSIANENNKLKYPFTTFSVSDSKKDYTYSWNFGNNEKSTTNFGKTIYKKAGNYKVQLFVKNNVNQCSQIFSKKITIKNGFDLFAPTGIKPNSQIDENKVFIPGALLGWDIKFEMTILDKSGKKIYSTTDKNEPWNGKLNNIGQTLKNDVYLWKVNTYDAEGNLHHHHGKVNLVN